MRLKSFLGELNNKVLIISGPTASGKSALAVNLAKQFEGEVINADSVQVYRHFDIGSGKITGEEMAGVPHHLLSVLEPDEPFDAKQFSDMARALISEIANRGKLPIVVGGTGLYVRSLLHGLVATAGEDGVEVTGSTDELYRELGEIDPGSAARVNRNDRVRIIRALKVALSSGSSLAELQHTHGNKELFCPAMVLVVAPEREVLYQAIDRRVEQMLAAGLVSETRAILERWGEVRPLGAIGYEQVLDYLKGELSEAELLPEIQRETRRYAKRQLTWWRNQPQALGWQARDGESLTTTITKFFAEERAAVSYQIIGEGLQRLRG